MGEPLGAAFADTYLAEGTKVPQETPPFRAWDKRLRQCRRSLSARRLADEWHDVEAAFGGFVDVMQHRLTLVARSVHPTARMNRTRLVIPNFQSS
ncbi:MAG TPA: hypothetical protein VIQ05_18810 [Tardiphaga sp.]